MTVLACHISTHKLLIYQFLVISQWFSGKWEKSSIIRTKIRPKVVLKNSFKIGLHVSIYVRTYQKKSKRRPKFSLWQPTGYPEQICWTLPQNWLATDNTIRYPSSWTMMPTPLLLFFLVLTPPLNDNLFKNMIGIISINNKLSKRICNIFI